MILGELLSRNARRYPDKTALVCGDTRLSFKQLNDRVNRLANGLVSLGLGKGDRVVIMADAGPEHIELSFATMERGMVVAPMNPRLPSRDLLHLINNAAPRVLVLGQDYRPLMESLRPDIRSVERFIVTGPTHDGMTGYEELLSLQPATEPAAPLREDDPLFLICSGGTTGLSKQIVHNYRSSLATMLNTMWLFGVQHDDVLCWCTPPFWGHMVPWLIAPHYYHGCTVVMLKDVSPDSMLQAIEREGVTTSMMSSGFLVSLLDCPNLAKHDLRSLRRLAVGGMPLPAEVWKRAKATFGNAVGQVYGQSELSPLSNLFPWEMNPSGTDRDVHRMRSVGREAIDVELRIVNERGEPVAPGEVGEVIGRGDSMMVGYWNNPRATQKTIRDGWVYTGDLATMDEDGYVYLLGRQADVITTAGKVLSPTEIEEAVYQHPGVYEAAVIGVPDKDAGESVKAIVVLKQDAKSSAEDIIGLCRRLLPAHAVPRTVEFVSELPRSPVGKVLKQTLRQQYSQG